MVRRTWVSHIGMSNLSAREHWRSVVITALVPLGPILAVASLWVVGSVVVALLLLLSALIWALLSAFSRVRVGIDQVEIWSVMGRERISNADILAFLHEGPEHTRGWYIETPRGLVPIGMGPASTKLVQRMLAAWPYIQKPEGDSIRALGSPAYRHAMHEPHELVQILRIPSLAPEERLRVARILAQHGPEYRREVEQIAEATLDADERERLRSV